MFLFPASENLLKLPSSEPTPPALDRPPSYLRPQHIRVASGPVKVTAINNPCGCGALVTKMDSGCAAARAGLRVGDVIRTINYAPTGSHEAATDAIKAAQEGEVVIGLGVSVGLLSATLPAASGGLGIRIRGDATAGGVRILELEPGGLGQQAGMQVGDELIAVDGEVAADHAQAMRRLKRATGDVPIVYAPAREYRPLFL